MGERDGIAGAVAAEVYAADETTPADAEQLELLPAPALSVRRGPGRPPGSLNRKTEQWVKLILARYPSPLVALAETYNRPVAELARELGCSKLDAFEAQQRAAIALAPFLHQRLPLAIQVEGKGAIPVMLVPLDQQGDAHDGMEFGAVLQHQGLSADQATELEPAELEVKEKGKGVTRA